MFMHLYQSSSKMSGHTVLSSKSTYHKFFTVNSKLKVYFCITIFTLRLFTIQIYYSINNYCRDKLANPKNQKREKGKGKDEEKAGNLMMIYDEQDIC